MDGCHLALELEPPTLRACGGQGQEVVLVVRFHAVSTFPLFSSQNLSVLTPCQELLRAELLALARARMPRDGVALLPPRPHGRIYEAARMLHASARFKAHAGEYLRGLPPQVG